MSTRAAGCRHLAACCWLPTPQSSVSHRDVQVESACMHALVERIRPGRDSARCSHVLADKGQTSAWPLLWLHNQQPRVCHVPRSPLASWCFLLVLPPVRHARTCVCFSLPPHPSLSPSIPASLSPPCSLRRSLSLLSPSLCLSLSLSARSGGRAMLWGHGSGGDGGHQWASDAPARPW